jgi:hypothetical protein
VTSCFAEVWSAVHLETLQVQSTAMTSKTNDALCGLFPIERCALTDVLLRFDIFCLHVYRSAGTPLWKTLSRYCVCIDQ